MFMESINSKKEVLKSLPSVVTLPELSAELKRSLRWSVPIDYSRSAESQIAMYGAPVVLHLWVLVSFASGNLSPVFSSREVLRSRKWIIVENLHSGSVDIEPT